MRLTIAHKLLLGFGSVILLMALTFVLGLVSTSAVGDAKTEANADASSAEAMVMRVVDHYRWLDGLNSAIVQNKPTVDVGVDPTQCGLGKWLESETTRQLAATDPEAKRLIEAIDQPHRRLHATAEQIRGVWRQRHDGLVEKLHDVRDAHRVWAQDLAGTILAGAESADVQMDPDACEFGQMLGSAEFRGWAANFDLLGRAIDPAVTHHRELHASARTIDQHLNAGDLAAARAHFTDATLPALARVSGALDQAVEAEGAILDGQARAREVLQTETTAALDQTQASLMELRDHLVTRSEAADARLDSALASMTWTNLVLILLATVIAVLAGLLLGRSIVSGVNALQASFARMQDGDLTERCELNRVDELGDLSTGFNSLGEQLREVVLEVERTSQEVASASSQIAASSEEISTGVAQQSDQVTQVASAIEEMAASVVEVARKSADASSKAEASGESAREGGLVVKETVEGMEAINATVTASAQSVEALGRRGEEIGQIIEVINDIADQTNLLALNAAIEAARAGEHGRGFAVVADEVRKLADRTTKATEEIAESIQQIRAETTEAVSRMKAGSDEVASGMQRAQKAGGSLQTIVAAAGDVSEMIRSIAAAAEEQSSASEQVSRNVESISAVAQQSGEGTRQAAAAAAQLSAKADQLQSLIARFKLN